MPSIYTSGPISVIGPPTWNRPAFEVAADNLCSAGWSVITPFDNECDPALDPREVHMKADIGLLLTCDAIYFLKGWEKSPGAFVEMLVARSIGLCVFHEDSDLWRAFDYKVPSPNHLNTANRRNRWGLTHEEWLGLTASDVVDWRSDAKTPAQLTTTQAKIDEQLLQETFCNPEMLKPSAKTVDEPLTVCQEAQNITFGDRNRDYGHPLDNLQHTADMWTAYLKRMAPELELDTDDVCVLMCMLKFSRQVETPKRDNWVDTAGYANIAEVAREEARRRKDIPSLLKEQAL